MQDLTTEAVKREAVRRIYEDHGESLVRNLLHASVFVLPSYTLVGVGEVLYDLIQFRNKVKYFFPLPFYSVLHVPKPVRIIFMSIAL